MTGAFKGRWPLDAPVYVCVPLPAPLPLSPVSPFSQQNPQRAVGTDTGNYGGITVESRFITNRQI